MKNYITIVASLLFTISAIAQVSIGDPTPLDGAILHFENPGTKGIALPKVITLDAASVPGTFYFDTNDTKVKFIDNSGTIDLSVKDVPVGSEFDVTAYGYDQLTEVVDVQGTILGDEAAVTAAIAAGTPGTLILEATDAALVLPNVESPHLTIKDPEPGMIAYDTVSKMLCVYNGVQWSFWGE